MVRIDWMDDIKKVVLECNSQAPRSSSPCNECGAAHTANFTIHMKADLIEGCYVQDDGEVRFLIVALHMSDNEHPAPST